MSDQDQEPSLSGPEGIQRSEEDQTPHPTATSTQQTDDTAAPPLEPFFTLVTNSTTGSTVHPRVQYLFSDDDPSVLSSPVAHGSPRPLVVDLVPSADNTSWSVSWASSLSSDFALTNSYISVQHDANASDDKSTTLRLEGVERDPPESSPSLPSSGSGVALGREDADSLAEEFRRRIGILKKVVGESEKRRIIAETQTPLQDEHAAEANAEADDVAVEGESTHEKDTTQESLRAEHAEAVGSTWG